MVCVCARATQPEDKEWEARKEKMAQMEAILMASVNHPQIVHTLKVRPPARARVCVYACMGPEGVGAD